MIVNLRLITETSGARKFRKANGEEVWIPRSLTKSIVKLGTYQGGYQECQVELEDWVADKNNL